MVRIGRDSNSARLPSISRRRLLEFCADTSESRFADFDHSYNLRRLARKRWGCEVSSANAEISDTRKEIRHLPLMRNLGIVSLLAVFQTTLGISSAARPYLCQGGFLTRDWSTPPKSGAVIKSLMGRVGGISLRMVARIDAEPSRAPSLNAAGLLLLHAPRAEI